MTQFILIKRQVSTAAFFQDSPRETDICFMGQDHVHHACTVRLKYLELLAGVFLPKR